MVVLLAFSKSANLVYLFYWQLKYCNNGSLHPTNGASWIPSYLLYEASYRGPPRMWSFGGWEAATRNENNCHIQSLIVAIHNMFSWYSVGVVIDPGQVSFLSWKFFWELSPSLSGHPSIPCARAHHPFASQTRDRRNLTTVATIFQLAMVCHGKPIKYSQSHLPSCQTILGANGT